MMKNLTIYRQFFTEADCYKKGVRQKPRGVQVHSTGANNPYLRRYVQPDDGRLGVNTYGNSHNRPGLSTCASAYIGRLQDGTVAVYQTLPWDFRCWLSGSGNSGNANKLGFIGFEICEDSTENRQYFDEAVRGAAVLLTAYLCQEYGFTPWTTVSTPAGDACAVEDHAGLHRLGLASNHGDIGLWLKKFGYTFRDFRAWVQEAMEEGVAVQYDDEEAEPMIEHKTLKRGDSGDAVSYLQTLLGDVGESLTADGVFGQMTEAAVRDFQRVYGLEIDGVVGPKTWAALEAATGHQEGSGAENVTMYGDDAAVETVTEAAEGNRQEFVTLTKGEWDAFKAAAVVMYQTVKQHEGDVPWAVG